MGVAKSLKAKIESLSDAEIDRLVRMGWEDRTTFEVIETQFGITPNEFVRFMRTHLSRKAFLLWRKRVHEKGHLKNEKTRGFKTSRFKARGQSVDSLVKGRK